MNLVVLDGYTTNPGDCSWDSVAKFGSLDVFERSTVQEIQQRAMNADVVLTNKTPLSAKILAELPNLKLICVLATGVLEWCPGVVGLSLVPTCLEVRHQVKRYLHWF
jgi:glycerate dehydrogenase